MARKIAVHHFGKSIKKIEFQPAGKTNFVFEVRTKADSYIVRIAASRTQLHNFIKEQWATHKAAEKGVPVPEILEVGNEIVSLPYMLQKKIDGREAVDHPQRLDILQNLGEFARLIHSIPTTGFGNVFDWSKNKLSRQSTWVEFLQNELDVQQRLNFLEKQNILSKSKITRLVSFFDKIKKWKVKPSLNHSDLRLKNVIVNDKGKILAIIDWDNCASNLAPYWDFSIALHDLSIDGKHRFLEGYGLNFREFENMSYALTAFNLINYVPSVERIIERKEKVKLELYKLRLNGSLDLFSL